MVFCYDVTESEAASTALWAASERLLLFSGKPQPANSTASSLRLVSMKESFDLDLLTRFYNELMIPNFPLEDERDDLDDWVYCLDPSNKNCREEMQMLYPSMDVLILLKEEEYCQEETDATTTKTTTTSIVAGVAFEYYRQAECGLVSYVVVSNEFRRLGIMGNLHPVACQAIQLLHRESISMSTRDDDDDSSNSTAKAIFAETNTVDAGDAPPAMIRKRHEILYQLGYRQLKFPYIQPALAEDAESFDEVMLLVYRPDDIETATIDTEILHDYVVDFFQSVTGYDNDSYKNHWYYELVDWFRNEYSHTEITRDLPWNDNKQEMKDRMIESSSSNAIECSANGKQNHHVVVVGAGIAGLVATVTLAEEYLQQPQPQDSTRLPLKVTLIEANPFVGGRIRTVSGGSHDSDPYMFNNERLPPSQRVDGFAPWPVPIGAEFVHGVDSMANRLIEDHEEWVVHETFDLCGSSEEYPSRNSFVRRRSSLSLSLEQRQTPHVFLFLNGQCHPLRENRGCYDAISSVSTEQSHTQSLIHRANAIWQTLQTIGEEIDATDDINEGFTKYGHDMSLDQFIEEQLSLEHDDLTAGDVDNVKKILESLFSNTAGSSNQFLGIHEASREEWNWEYTESNFRSEQCFNEFIKYYIDRIAVINKQAEESNLDIHIDLEVDCPVTEIGSAFIDDQNKNAKSQGPIRMLTRNGKDFDCDKCIVTVPLGVLKANKIEFRHDYTLPRDTQDAINTINMFSGMKAHMLLKVGTDIERISRHMQNTELLFCPGELYSQIWLRRNEDTVFLTGFCVANCRDRFIEMVTTSGKDGEEFKSQIAKDMMLDQVCRIFETSSEEGNIFLEPSSPTCSCFALHDWSDDEFTMGIYSSPSVGAGWANGRAGENTSPLTHRDFLSKPINNSVWFAGEHANTTTCATVQSAMESGAKAAKEVYRSLQ